LFIVYTVHKLLILLHEVSQTVRNCFSVCNVFLYFNQCRPIHLLEKFPHKFTFFICLNIRGCLPPIFHGQEFGHCCCCMVGDHSSQYRWIWRRLQVGRWWFPHSTQTDELSSHHCIGWPIFPRVCCPELQQVKRKRCMDIIGTSLFALRWGRSTGKRSNSYA